MLTRLVLTLAMLTPPSQEAADAAFNAGDYARALEMFEERAADPAVHLPDAVGGARDSLLALYAETGDAAHLCRARDLDRDLLAREVFADASERLGWVETEAKDVAKIDAAGQSPISRSHPRGGCGPR